MKPSLIILTFNCWNIHWSKLNWQFDNFAMLRKVHWDHTKDFIWAGILTTNLLFTLWCFGFFMLFLFYLQILESFILHPRSANHYTSKEKLFLKLSLFSHHPHTAACGPLSVKVLGGADSDCGRLKISDLLLGLRTGLFIIRWDEKIFTSIFNCKSIL